MKKLIYLSLLCLLIASCGEGRIIDKPIIFDQERIDLTLDYLDKRYGLKQEEPMITPKMIVVHHTAIPTLEKSFDAFEKAKLPDWRPEIVGASALNVSSQFLVDQDGTIYRLMPETQMARHVIGLNHCAIGIENVGGTQDTPLTEAQLEANIWLVKYLKRNYDISFLIGHSEYTNFEGHELWLEVDDAYRTEKSDPGDEFLSALRKSTKDLEFLPTPKKSFDQLLFNGYENYKEPTLSVRRIKHAQIQPLIEKAKKNEKCRVTKLGQSIEGRNILMISVGTGEVDVLLWSQMHGDEPTATMAIFDILNFLFSSQELQKEKSEMLENVTLHFIPMLNPDGAEQFKRRNALDVDINRDALRLQSPESKILKKTRDSLNADFGFNLHDQSRYYNAERTEKPATISYLAPAYNYEKEVNDVRANAMKVIVLMNNVIQKYAEGQVGRYSDSFEPRAFGDNIQKWGTSAILIESGGYLNDREKQFIRKLNYISILSAIFSIADGSYANVSIDEYEKIPSNDRKMFDLKIENVLYDLHDHDYILDVGINLGEKDNQVHNDFHYKSWVSELGDLSTYYGYKTIDASGLRYEPGKLYLDGVENEKAISSIQLLPLLQKGYTSIQLKGISSETKYSKWPINLTKSSDKPQPNLKLGSNASFLLMDGNEIKYVIVNGFVMDPSKPNLGISNGVIK